MVAVNESKKLHHQTAYGNLTKSAEADSIVPRLSGRVLKENGGTNEPTFETQSFRNSPRGVYDNSEALAKWRSRGAEK